MEFMGIARRNLTNTEAKVSLTLILEIYSLSALPGTGQFEERDLNRLLFF